MDSEGQLRDTYDILEDLAKVYPTLTTNQRQYLGELIAGKRQVSVLESLLTNWESVDKATQAAAKSAGSASEEEARYLDSVEGKTQQMLSAFEQLSANTLDSSWLKGLIDTSTAVIELTDNVGLLNVAFGAFVAYATFKNNGSPKALWENLSGSIVAIKDNVMKTTASLDDQDKAVKEALLSQTKLKTLVEQKAYLDKQEIAYNEATLGVIHQQITAERALNAVKSIGVGILGAIAGMALSAIISSTAEAFHEWTHPIETAKENLDEISNELESANSELDGLKNSTKDLTPQEETRLQVLQAQTEQLKQQQELQAQTTGKMQFKDTGGGEVIRQQKYDGTFTYKYKVDASEVEAFNAKLEDGTNYTVHADMSEIEEAKQTMIDAANAISEAGVNATEEQKEAYNQSVENYNEVATQYADIFAQMTELQEKGYVLSDTQSEALSNYINYINNSKDEISELTETVNVLDNHYLSLTDTMDSLAESTDLLTTAWNEADTNGQLSLDTVMKLIDAGGQYMDLLVEENGVYKLNADAASALFEIQKQEKIADIQMEKQSLQVKIAATQAAIAAYNAGSAVSKGQTEDAKGRMQSLSAEAANILAAFGETSDGVNKALNKALNSITIKNSTQLKSYENALNEMQAKVGQYDKAINVISSLSLPSYTKATKGSTSASKKNADATKKQNQQLEKLRNNLDKLKDDLSSTQEAYEAMQDAIIKQLEKEISLQEKRREELERLQDIYEAQQDKAQDIIQAEIDALQEQMDALDEKNDKEEEALKLKEAQLEAQKAQDAYDAAKANKNTRVYEEGIGWTWQANPEDVKEAEENLAEANKNLTEIQKEQELAHKKQDIQGQIDDLNDLLDAWQTNLGDINDEIKNSSEVLDFATKFQNASLEERKQMLQQFTGSYVTEVDEQIKETDKQIENLKDLKSQWQNAMDIQADISKYAGAQEWLRKFEQATYEQRKQMLSLFTNSWVSYYNTQTAKINDAQQAVDRMSGSMNNANNSGYNTSGLSNYRNATNQVANAAVNAQNELSAMERKAMNSILNTSNWMNNLFGGYSSGKTSGGGGAGSRNFGGVSNFSPGRQRSANGNVDYFSSSNGGIIDYTGEWGDGKNWVDGTPNKPEVILNNDQAANVLYELAKAPNSRLADTTGGKSNKEMFIVNELNITANNQDTLQGLLLQAKQMAITK